jgi:hypothetical protein
LLYSSISGASTVPKKEILTMLKLILGSTSRRFAAVAFIAGTLPLWAQQAAKSGPTKCTDIPISITFTATIVAPATIWNDNPTTPYVGGQQGVSNTVIHRCSGTYDATMALSSSKRYVNMQLSLPLAIPVAGPPSFAGGSAFLTQPFFNVRDVLLGGAIHSNSLAQSFYTRMGIDGIGAPDGNKYRFVDHPDDDGNCPGGLACATDYDPPSLLDMNSPVEASWVLVTFNPATSTSSAYWIVDGETPDTLQSGGVSGAYQRGSLYILSKSGSVGSQEGQYAMPFQIIITALSSF